MHDLGQSRRIRHDASTMMIADQASDLIRPARRGLAEIVATPTRISLYGDGERVRIPRGVRLCYSLPMLQGDISEEPTMTRSILIGLAVLTLSTSVALAAQRTHHRAAMNANASVAASPVVWPGFY
jgi:hypothetical protein